MKFLIWFIWNIGARMKEFGAILLHLLLETGSQWNYYGVHFWNIVSELMKHGFKSIKLWDLFPRKFKQTGYGEIQIVNTCTCISIYHTISTNYFSYKILIIIDLTQKAFIANVFYFVQRSVNMEVGYVNPLTPTDGFCSIQKKKMEESIVVIQCRKD